MVLFKERTMDEVRTGGGKPRLPALQPAPSHVLLKLSGHALPRAWAWPPAQSLDERRLSLILDKNGNVTSASGSPASLFGFEPGGLLSQHLSRVVDVLQPSARVPAGDMAALIEWQETATKIVMQMAQRCARRGQDADVATRLRRPAGCRHAPRRAAQI